MAAHPATWVAGTFDPAIGRTQLLVEGMRARGWPVATCIEPVWGGTHQRVAVARGGLANPRLAWRLARAYATLGLRLRQQRPTPRILLLGYPGQLDAIVLRALFPRAAIILDAFVALDETLADRGIAGPGSPTRRLARTLDRLALRAADRSIVDTAAHARRFALHYGLDPPRAVIVPVGAHDPQGTGALQGTHPQSAIRNPQSAIQVLYFGGFIPLHGVPTVLEAARRISPEEGIGFTLVGDGQDADAAERALRAAPLPHVRLLRAWMPEADLVAQHVAAADVCLGIFGNGDKALDVVPAKVYLALACGRPIVTGDTPAIREEVLARADTEDPPLLAVPPGDAAALADALRRLAADPGLRGRMGMSARRAYDQHFRPEVAVGPLLDAITALAG